MKAKYKVIGSSRKNADAWIVEGRDLSYSKALALSKKHRGEYYGISERSHHTKQKGEHTKHHYHYYTKVVKE